MYRISKIEHVSSTIFIFQDPLQGYPTFNLSQHQNLYAEDLSLSFIFVVLMCYKIVV